jgi:hypothetical protein
MTTGTFAEHRPWPAQQGEQMILENLSDIIMVVATLSISLLALVGGFSVIIVRLRGRQRMEELDRLERIAAIERGLDPSRPTVTRNV